MFSFSKHFGGVERWTRQLAADSRNCDCAGLSQRQLARQSGVANATISQIEAGKLNPTVSMLKKVLDGFPITLSEFFSDEPETRTACSFAPRS